MNAELTWIPAGGNSSSQDVEYKLKSSPDWITYISLPPTVNTITIPDLLQNEIYQFRIVNICNGARIASPLEEKISFTCVESTATQVLNKNSVKVSFSHLYGSIGSYTVYFYKKSDGSLFLSRDVTGELPPLVELILNGFAWSTEYTYVVVPKADQHSKTNCTKTPIVIGSEPICNPVTNLAVNLTGSTLTITFDSNPTSKSIMYKVKGSPDSSFIQLLPNPTQSPVTVTVNDPTKDYEVSVRVFCGGDLYSSDVRRSSNAHTISPCSVLMIGTETFASSTCVIYSFEPETNVITKRADIDICGPDIAHTANRMWIGNQKIHEWVLTSSPFSLTYNREILLPEGVYNGTGLAAIDNNTLVGGGSTISKFDISGSTVVATPIFTLPSQWFIAGDIIYVPIHNKYITLSNYDGSNLHRISQYSAQGVLENEIDAYQNYLYGLHQYNGEIYVTRGNGELYKITSDGLQLVTDLLKNINGASQVPSCCTSLLPDFNFNRYAYGSNTVEALCTTEGTGSSVYYTAGLETLVDGMVIYKNAEKTIPWDLYPYIRLYDSYLKKFVRYSVSPQGVVTSLPDDICVEPVCNPVTNLVASVDNTTLTLTFDNSGSQQKIVKYKIKGEPDSSYVTVTPNPTTSPIVITGIERYKDYEGTVLTKCSNTSFSNEVGFATQIPMNNLQPFDYLVLRYHWDATSGVDLDTFTGFIETGTPFDNDWVGYNQGEGKVPNNNSLEPYIHWGGDNTGTDGVEAILINFNKFYADHPTLADEVKLKMNAVWWTSVNSGNIKVSFTTYLGGTMSHDAPNKNFINTGGSQVNNIILDTNVMIQNKQANILSSEDVAIFTYNNITKKASIELA